MKKNITIIPMIILVLFVFSSICLAATTVSGGGKQIRGYPGHNAEVDGKLFTLPGTGTITNIDQQGASGFWIEDQNGSLIVVFDTINQALGYNLRAGSYRVLPHLADGYNSCWINVTFACP